MRHSSNNNKDLDKLFQSRLRNDNPADNDWNVPPIDIFDKAIASLEEEPEKKKRYWLPFVFISLIIAGITFVVVRNARMIDRLDDKIENLNKQQSQDRILTKTENKVEKANFLQSQTQTNQIQSSQGKSSQGEPSEIISAIGQPVTQKFELEISDNVKLEDLKGNLNANPKKLSNLEKIPSSVGEKVSTESRIADTSLDKEIHKLINK